MWHPLIIPPLDDAGLRLQAVSGVGSLSEATTDALPSAPAAPSGHTMQWRSLLLFAQVGGSLWRQHIAAAIDSTPDPVDTISIGLVADWLAVTFPEASYEIAYPSDAPLPLGTLAEQAGWGQPSPLGLTINPTYGLWLAHRVAVVTSIDAAELVAAYPTPTTSTTAGAQTHPCLECPAPCVDACPADAVHFVDGFNVEACAHFRIEPDSPCAYQCLARNACPVAIDLRYGDAQMHHHYASGLASIRNWLG